MRSQRSRTAGQCWCSWSLEGLARPTTISPGSPTPASRPPRSRSGSPTGRQRRAGGAVAHDPPDHPRQRVHPVQRPDRLVVRGGDRVRRLPRRAVRRRHRRQHADRHRPGAPRQADARQSHRRQRPEGHTPCATATVTAARGQRARARRRDRPASPASRSSPTRRCSTATNLEIDESLLTGEADPVVKQPGDELLVGQLRRRRHRPGAGHQGRRRRLRGASSPRRRAGSRSCTASCAPSIDRIVTARHVAARADRASRCSSASCDVVDDRHHATAWSSRASAAWSRWCPRA